MPTTNQNLECAQGDDFSFAVAVLPYTDGSVADLTGATAQWELCEGNYQGAATLLTKDTPPGIFVDVSGAQIVIELDAIDTESIPPGRYFHQVRINLSTGIISHIASGAFDLHFSGVP
jgi:hypothetical protein